MKHFAIALLALLSLAANAQPCTPNPTYADSITPGVYGINSAMVQGGNIYTVFDLITDTVALNIPGYYYVKAMKICKVELPNGWICGAGYNAEVAGNDCWANEGIEHNWDPVQGCFAISGTAVPNGGYPIAVYFDLYASDSSGTPNYVWLSTIQPDCSYSIVYTDTIHVYLEGLEELNPSTFSVGQSYPNPAAGLVSIPYNTVRPETVNISIYNALGSLVHSAELISAAGKNTYSFDATTLAAGVYYYRIGNGNECVVKRMLVE